MKPRSYTSEGIILARQNYSEADRILAVFSKDRGKIFLVAKGVRKPSSRKRGSLEIFSQIRFSAKRGKSLDLITEVETVDGFNQIRKNLKKVALAYYFMEIVGRVTREEEANLEVFNLLSQSLHLLKQGKNLKQIRLDFARDLLTATGFWPKGKLLIAVDEKLEEIIEKKPASFRVGKMMVE